MLDDSNVQHEKLVLKLVEPNIIGYSVPKLSESTENSTLEPSSEKSEPEPPKKKQKVK